jgi:hypothetical protein
VPQSVDDTGDPHLHELAKEQSGCEYLDDENQVPAGVEIEDKEALELRDRPRRATSSGTK